MTGRGRAAAPPERPITPPDPSLETRPVSRKRTFNVKSFGSGASSDIRQTVQTLKQLDNPEDQTGGAVGSDENYSPNFDEVRKLLQAIQDWEAVSWFSDGRSVTADPTWGFCVFLTDYSADTLTQLSTAMENLVKAEQHSLENGYMVKRIYADEAVKRFKLDVVVDETALDGASDERVREEFRAYVRGLELSDEDDDTFHLPARNIACLRISGDDVARLAGLSFPENPEETQVAFEGETLRVIDVNYHRPVSGTAPQGAYRGVGDVSIGQLARLYYELTDGPESGNMQGLHPLNGPP